MHKAFRASAALAVLLASWTPACGGLSCVDPTGELGSCCSPAQPCGQNLRCFESFPAGLCSLDCSADRRCPAGSSCVTVISRSRGDLGTVCLTDCGSGLPACRAGYACQQTSVASIQVCFPG
ncbi:MAG: hypothetical protein JXR96_00435 [Deltaproteobacteria bacterium]|nr:hypothetical protein [Deltaproteobacteria bacterium]